MQNKKERTKKKKEKKNRQQQCSWKICTYFMNMSANRSMKIMWVSSLSLAEVNIAMHHDSLVWQLPLPYVCVYPSSSYGWERHTDKIVVYRDSAVCGATCRSNSISRMAKVQWVSAVADKNEKKQKTKKKQAIRLVRRHRGMVLGLVLKPTWDKCAPDVRT